MLVSIGRTLLASTLSLWLFAGGCSTRATQPSSAAPSSASPQSTIPDGDAAAIAARLHAIAAAGRLENLRWPDFSDYRLHFQHAYEGSNFLPLWLNGNHPTPQALGLIQAFSASHEKGLDPDEYNAPRWQQRIAALQASGATAEMLADFDAALTVGAMRYISDLHIGRVDPRHFQFGIDIDQKKYDLPQFVLEKVAHAQNVAQVLDGVEPSYPGYKSTETALHHYAQLAQQGDGPKVPDVQKSVAVGDAFDGSAALAARLRLLGDLASGATQDADTHTYSASLSQAVRNFQVRHGLAPDGKLSKETVQQLNVPLAVRVTQLQDALERWRWLPPQFPQPPVVVNIPEFVLRVFDADHHVVLQMNVVVGRALRTQTPVFAQQMKYIIFRPYWNIPPSIVHKEVLPSLAKDRGYLGRKDMEITDTSGRVVSSGTVSGDMLAQLRAGRLMVRQKPGPSNSLGLIKFIFPNTDNVYLHSTPAPQLFGQSRRDFSHGCVRVEKPAELAALLLANQGWTLEQAQAAMQSGPDNRQVNLKTPVPVLIFYLTALAEEDGSVHFFDDIYGYDKTLNAVLAKGPPYPYQQ